MRHFFRMMSKICQNDKNKDVCLLRQAVKSNYVAKWIWFVPKVNIYTLHSVWYNLYVNESFQNKARKEQNRKVRNMKRKFLSLFVCMTIFASFIPLWTVSVTATQNAMTRTGETCIFSEDFEGYNGHTINVAYPRNTPSDGRLTSSDTDGHIMWAGGTTTIDGDSSSWSGYGPTGRGGGTGFRLCSYQQTNNSRNAGIYTPYDQKQSTGIVHSTMDFKIPTTALDGSAADLSAFIIYIFPDNYIWSGNCTRIAENANLWNNLTLGTWYTMDLWVDLDQDIFSVTYTDDTGIVAYQNMGAYAYNFSGIRFSLTKSDKTNSWNDVTPIIDNVWIGKLNDTIDKPIRIDGEKTLFYENFEASTSVGSDWYDNDYQTEGGFRSWNSDGRISGFNSVGSFSPVCGLEASSRTLEWYRPDPDGSSGPAAGGTYHVRFNYKPGTYATSGHNIYVYGYNSTLQDGGAKKLKGTKVTLLGRDTINGFGNRWVTVDIYIADDNKAMLHVTNATTGADLYTVNNIALGFDRFYAVVFSNVGPSTAWTQVNSPAIDNFYVGVGYNYPYLQETLASENFNSWTNSTAAGLYNTGAKTTGGFQTSTNYIGSQDAYGVSGAHSLALGLYKNTKIGALDYYIGSNNEKQQNGQIHIQYDWRRGSTVTAENLLIGEGDDKVSGTYDKPIPSATLTALDLETWYTIDLIIDLDARLIDWRIYTIEDNDIAIVESGNTTYTKTNFGYIAWECNRAETETWGEAKTAAIDNFYMGKIKDNSLAVSLDGSTITAQADIRNCMLSQAKPAVVIIGQYSSAGELVKIDYLETTVPANTIAGGSRSTTATKLGTASTVKAFLWNDLTNYRPLIEGETLE